MQVKRVVGGLARDRGRATRRVPGDPHRSTPVPVRYLQPTGM